MSTWELIFVFSLNSEGYGKWLRGLLMIRVR